MAGEGDRNKEGQVVANTRAVVRAIPLVRRLEPTLAAAWHDVDRSHRLYETRRRLWLATHGRRRRFPLRVAFTPEAPRYFHGAYQLCVRLNVDTVPPADADVIFYWSDVTLRDEPPPDLDPHAINARVRDIGKRHVNDLHRQVFGYDLSPEPGATQLVDKSEANAMHDGRIVDHPSGAPGVVTQRLIDNCLDDNLVTDHRVSVMDGRIVWTSVRYRPVSDRFNRTDVHLMQVLHPPEAYFSPAEQEQLVAICEALGADWAELDVLRDRPSGRLYVVDVNPTLAVPLTGMLAAALAVYWHLQEQGFADLLHAHTR